MDGFQAAGGEPSDDDDGDGASERADVGEGADVGVGEGADADVGANMGANVGEKRSMV